MRRRFFAFKGGEMKRKQVIDRDGRMPSGKASKPKRTARKKFKRQQSAGMHQRRVKKIEW